MRTYNCLKRSGITKVGQVLRMDKKELLGLRNFGEKSFEELYQSLFSRDLIPPGTPLDIPSEEALASEGAEDEEEVGYATFDGIEPEPDAYIGDVDTVEEDDSVQIVDLAGVSEGSAQAAAGIYIDDEPAAQEMNFVGETVPQTGFVDSQKGDEAREEEAEAKPKARSRKKS
jgi:hypothetical protein